MREWCSCGAAIRAGRNDVLNWRGNHNHPGATPETEPDKGGSESRVESFGFRRFESVTNNPTGHDTDVPVVNARTGFQPNV